MNLVKHRMLPIKSGKFGFTIPEIAVAGTRIRYTVFATYVEQRQAVSKALRKIKPEADQ